MCDTRDCIKFVLIDTTEYILILIQGFEGKLLILLQRCRTLVPTIFGVILRHFKSSINGLVLAREVQFWTIVLLFENLVLFLLLHIILIQGQLHVHLIHTSNLLVGRIRILLSIFFRLQSHVTKHVIYIYIACIYI